MSTGAVGNFGVRAPSFDSEDNLKPESNSNLFQHSTTQSVSSTSTKITAEKITLFNQLCKVRVEFFDNLITNDYTFVGKDEAYSKMDEYFHGIGSIISGSNFTKEESKKIMIGFNRKTRKELKSFCKKWKLNVTKDIITTFEQKKITEKICTRRLLNIYR